MQHHLYCICIPQKLCMALHLHAYFIGHTLCTITQPNCIPLTPPAAYKEEQSRSNEITAEFAYSCFHYGRLWDCDAPRGDYK